MIPSRVVCGGAVLLLCGACVTTAPIRANQSGVVYGEDDRIEVFEADPGLRLLADTASVVLIPGHFLDPAAATGVQLDVEPTLSELYGLCPGERFETQPSLADCSGTLIDDDLVLTAGHCVQSGECGSRRFVFRYYLAGADRLATIDRADDVYDCRRVVLHRETASLDYAVVQLDRPVSSRHAPAPLRSTVPQIGDALTLIGSGGGIPMKIESGGVVQSIEEGALWATVDAFEGNSGSGAFDLEGMLAGVLVSGETDYRATGTCFTVNELPNESDGEHLMLAASAVADLCATGWPSESLCTIAAACGDGLCTGTETSVTCGADCPLPFCGDGICNLGEDGSAPVCGDCDFSGGGGGCAAGGTGLPGGAIPFALFLFAGGGWLRLRS